MAYQKLGDRLKKNFGEIVQKGFKARKGKPVQYVQLSQVAKSLGVEPIFLLANFYHLCTTFKKSGNFLFVKYDGQDENDYSIGSYCHFGKQLGHSGMLNRFDDAVKTGNYDLQIDFIDKIWIRSSLAVRMYPRKVNKLLEREE